MNSAGRHRRRERKAGRLKDSGQEKATPGKNNKILLFPLCPAGRQGKSLKAAVMRFWKETEKNFLPFMTKILPVVTKGFDKSGKCGIILGRKMSGKILPGIFKYIYPF